MASKSFNPSVLKLISLREQGLIRNKIYKENIVSSQLKHEPQEPQSIEDMFKIYHFEYVRADTDGNLIGVSLYNSRLLLTNLRPKAISRIYVMHFTYNPSCVKGPKNRNSLISSFKTKKTLRECLIITDTTDVHIGGKNPILFAGNSYREGMAGLTYFNCEGKNLDYEWRVQGEAFCCTSCNFTQQFALGCEDGYYLFNTIRMDEKRVLIDENVLSLQFSNDGNFLLLSTDKKGVSICDIREHACYRRYCAIKQEYGTSCRKRYTIQTTSNHVREMKLLNDQTSLICVNHAGCLEKADIRMMKTVFQYQGHQEHMYRRSICLNEELDLICAPGKDKIVRIWSLSSGKLNYEKKVFDRTYCLLNNEPPHCCFVSNQRRWFLSVIQDNVLVPVVPNDEFPDASENDASFSYR
ncbi:uncharacterized protein [Parasteatoda tepidariorum]|uniref:uncharacterized protein n=1 Tax=Parasteatoda tepidariorum TaxID=114398 RepID=UPI00077FAA43|nr:uncharacterized protein LOC107441154 [Parasteatoda tepidariorum]